MSFQERAARNRALPCRVISCNKHRATISPFCTAHARAVEKHGNALGRAVARREYTMERQAVEQLLDRNAQHPAVQCALRFLGDWLAAAGRGERVPGARHMARLETHGVPAM